LKKMLGLCGNQPKTKELYADRGVRGEKQFPRLVCFYLRSRKVHFCAEEALALDSQQAAIAAWGGGVQRAASEEHPRSPFLRAGARRNGARMDGEDKQEAEIDEGRGAFAWRAPEGYVSTGFASRARATLGRQALTEEEEEGEEDQEGEKQGDGKKDGGAAGEVKEDEAEAEKENLSAMKPGVWSDFFEGRLDLRSFVEVPLWDVRQGTFSTHPA
jgi:hypothetical protein